MAWCPLRKYKNECWENAYSFWTEGWCKFWLCLILLMFETCLGTVQCIFYEVSH